MTFRPVLACASLVLCLVAHPLLAEVKIDRTEPVIERRSFDPKNPPQDMPKLDPNEAAVAQSYFGADTRVGGVVTQSRQVEGGNQRASVKVETVRMTLRLRVTIWLPENAVPKIINHEEGHRQIAEHYYRDAEKIARRLAEDLIGKTITGTGPDTEVAADGALQEAAHILGGKYLGETDVPSGKAQEEYDKITAHGTNAVKEDRAVKEAIQRAGG